MAFSLCLKERFTTFGHSDQTNTQSMPGTGDLFTEEGEPANREEYYKAFSTKQEIGE
jgi:hypothetical protein